jgi:hypothetical protein
MVAQYLYFLVQKGQVIRPFKALSTPQSPLRNCGVGDGGGGGSGGGAGGGSSAATTGP